MSADVIVQKYSQALFSACEENKKTDVVALEIAVVAKIFSEKETVVFFTSPFNSNDTKIMVAKSALEGKCSPELFNFIITLVKNGRVGQLVEICEAFKALVGGKSGETEGTLYVSGEITEDFKNKVEAKLSTALNKKVILKVEIDSALLAGHKISLGGWVFDDSAQFHLNKIKEVISKRGI